MAGESCNLDKEDAELLKPPSPSSASPSPPAAVAVASDPAPPSLFVNPPTQRTPESPASARAPAACAREERPEEEEEEEEAPPQGRSSSRCSSCQRRVGLTGFRCRCGVLFCARHRHADAHDCSFDYKSAGREEISRANPLIRAAKIIKI